MSRVSDESWKQDAEDSREALALMGYPVIPRCLPGEPNACGGTFAEHAMAHLATLKAICDHQLSHLGHPLAAQVHASTLLELEMDCQEAGHR
jgi:hypothetical protein